MMVLVIPPTPSAARLLPVLRRRPMPLLPIMGKPLVAYQLDLASSIGAGQVVILCDDRPEQVRRFTGDGLRWGLRTEVVAVAPRLTLADQVRRTELPNRDVLLLAGDAVVAPLPPERAHQEREHDWVDDSGWVLTHLDDDARDRLVRGVELVARADATRPECWRVDSLAGLHRLHMELVEDPHGLVVPGFRVAPGITVSRGSRFSLAAVEATPVFVGANARASHRSSLGPSVVLGPRSMVDDEARLTRTVVMPATYVGRLLDAQNVILDGQTIVRGDTGTVAVIGDDLLLSDLDRPVLGGQVAAWLNRLAGLSLLLLGWPLLALGCLASRRPRRLVRSALSHRVRYGVSGTVERLTLQVTHFNVDRPVLRWAVRLLDVARGRLALVGNPALLPETAAQLAPELVERWLEAPVGLFGLAQEEWLRAPAAVDLEELASAAALYAGTRSTVRDLRHLARCLVLVLAPSSWRRRSCGELELM